MDSCDGIIISLPENNFSVTAVWKNMLDYLSTTNPGNDKDNDWK